MLDCIRVQHDLTDPVVRSDRKVQAESEVVEVKLLSFEVLLVWVPKHSQCLQLVTP